MQGPKTNPQTMKTGKGVDSLMKFGNGGNTKGTKLPDGGKCRGSKKMGKRRKGY